MSTTEYYIDGSIPVSELVGGRLNKYGIEKFVSKDANENRICLTDGQNNFLWCYDNPVDNFIKYFPNGSPWFILRAIANEFRVEIFSEYDEVTPCHVPDTPTDKEIAVMKAEWRAECEAHRRDMAELNAKWQEERAAAG